MANRLSNKICFLASVLFASNALGNTSDGNQRLLLNAEEMKGALSLMGFDAPWSATESGVKQRLNNGELWIQNGHYFAVMAVRDENEQLMQLSLINNLSVCAQLGIAATGNTSESVFSAFSQLTGKALTQPETTVSKEQNPYHYHVLITEMVADRTLMQCGVKNQ